MLIEGYRFKLIVAAVIGFILFASGLILATAIALASPFETVLEAHNNGEPIASVMAPAPAAKWERMFAEGRGTGAFSDIRWHGNEGVARWDWTRGDESQSGWLALMTDDTRIRNWYYTERGPNLNHAIVGQAADGASTIVGMSTGFAEANPLFSGLSGPVIAASKIGVTAAVQEFAPLDQCIGFSRVAGPVGWGAAIWNVGAIAGLGPIGVVPAVLVAGASSQMDEPLWDCMPSELR